MLFKLIKYILIILLSIILFKCIPANYNPISDIYIFIILFLLIFYFFENSGMFEYFNDNNEKVPIENNNQPVPIENNNQPAPIENNIQPAPIENNIKPVPIENNNQSDTSSNNLVSLDNIFININNFVLPYLEYIITINDKNILKFKQEISEIILNIKQKSDPQDIYLKCEKINNSLIKNTESNNLFNHVINTMKSILFKQPIKINTEQIKNTITEPIKNNEITNNKDIIIYIKNHFLPLLNNFILKLVQYNKLPDKLKLEIQEIINLINNDLSNNELLINELFIKIKNIYNNINILLKDSELIKDNVANTYLLLIKTTINVIIKNYKLLLLQEQFDINLDINELIKESELIMKTYLGKIFKLKISLESKPVENTKIHTYLSVEFNSDIETILVNNDNNSITQISEMLKKLASKLDNNDNDCNCEKKVNEAVNKYLKNGKYIDDNGIIQNIINSDMIYNQLDVNMLQSLGSYDNTFSNKWDKGYTYLDTSKWAVPKVPIAPPPNMNNVQSSLTNGYPLNLLEFNNSRKVLGPDNINLNYIKDKLN
jgi:hypothetical protein